MSLEEVMPKVMQWGTAADALATLGALLAAQQPDVDVHPDVLAALQEVAKIAGLPDLTQLPPPQQQMALGVVRLYLHQAVDLVDHPDRQPGWAFTDTAILDGYGRGSAMLPMAMAASHPDLADVTAFLDVGTGVGLLAVAAANVWPKATVVGIDPYDTSLARARDNVAASGLGDRITLRQEELAAIDDVDAFDCIWIPTFFLTENVLEKSLGTAVRALRPGGWIVLGRTRPLPDPLAEATAALKWLRGGGTSLTEARAIELLEGAGCTQVHAPPPGGMTPIALVLGQRPAS